MKFLALSTLLVSTSVLATSVRITSFNYVRSGEALAELCGTVSDATTTPSFVRVQIDHTSTRPATYNTLTDTTGRFCVAVVTFRGTAEASVMNQSAPVVEALIAQ
jgi:hypothetical protein